jgi:hypothetical protein
MPLFTVTRTTTALSTSNDYMTIIASATKPLRIYVVDVKGDGTITAKNEVLMCRSTVGVGGGGAITPVKVNTGSAAASFTVYTTWSSSQPTLGDVLWRFEVNANGGIDKFVSLPGAEIPVPVSGQISIRAASGSAGSNMIANLLIEEVDG